MSSTCIPVKCTVDNRVLGVRAGCPRAQGDSGPAAVIARPGHGMQDRERPPQIQSLSEPRGTCRPRVEVKTAGRVGCLECRDRVGRDRGRRGYVRQRTPIGPHELEQVVRRSADPIPVLVDRAMMPTTEQQQVAERGGAVLGPVLDVMAFTQAGDAPREAARPVPVQEGTRGGRAGWCGCGPRSPPCGRPDRAASPLGWHRMRGAATFPRERGPPLPARIGRVESDPPARQRRRGPRPDSARPVLPGRARGAGRVSASRPIASACCCALVGRSGRIWPFLGQTRDR